VEAAAQVALRSTGVAELLPHIESEWREHVGTENLQFLGLATDCNKLATVCNSIGSPAGACNRLQQIATD
jgi:hypothetical protein